MTNIQVQRAFRPEFLRHAHQTNGWPSWPSLQRWRDAVAANCAQSNRPQIGLMRYQTYQNISNGEYADEHYLARILRYLLDEDHAHSVERLSLDAFLRDEMKLSDPEHLAFYKALESVTACREKAADDGCGEGADILDQLLINEGTLQYVRPIDAEDHSSVEEAIEWMFVDAGRQLTSRDHSKIRAAKQTAAAVNAGLEEYQSLARSWHGIEQWIVAHTMEPRGRKVNGVSVVTPVTELFYQRASRGECAAFACEESDIQVPSRHLIVQGIAPRSELGRGDSDLGLSLPAAALCQLARLSDGPQLRGMPVRVLSFTATPTGKRRLKSFGFEPLGTFFPPKTETEYVERVLSFEGPRKDPLYMGAWLGLQHRLRAAYGELPSRPQPA